MKCLKIDTHDEEYFEEKKSDVEIGIFIIEYKTIWYLNKSHDFNEGRRYYLRLFDMSQEFLVI